MEGRGPRREALRRRWFLSNGLAIGWRGFPRVISTSEAVESQSGQVLPNLLALGQAEAIDLSDDWPVIPDFNKHLWVMIGADPLKVDQVCIEGRITYLFS